MPARTATAGRALTVALISLLLVSGCSVRWDTPPPAPPTADAAEQARQTAAEESAQLAALAEAAGADLAGDGAANGLAGVETSAQAHLEALGGVWEPWPGAGPDATAFPTAPAPTPALPSGATVDDVVDALRAGADAARQAAETQPGELGQLLASIAISRHFAAADLNAMAAGGPSLPAGPLPADDVADLAAATVVTLDTARYAFEVVAAQSSGAQRDAAAERAAELARLAATDVAAEDGRQVAYDVTGPLSDVPDGTTPQRHLAASAELDVLGAYLERLGSTDPAAPEDPAALIAAATYAAEQARSWDAELSPLPGLG